MISINSGIQCLNFKGYKSYSYIMYKEDATQKNLFVLNIKGMFTTKCLFSASRWHAHVHACSHSVKYACVQINCQRHAQAFYTLRCVHMFAMLMYIYQWYTYQHARANIYILHINIYMPANAYMSPRCVTEVQKYNRHSEALTKLHLFSQSLQVLRILSVARAHSSIEIGSSSHELPDTPPALASDRTHYRTYRALQSHLR